MIVQVREDRLWMIEQHEHARVSGEMAHRWRMEGAALPFSWVQAAVLHDMAWIEEDRAPRFDASTGLFHDFVRFPPERRLGVYAEGLSRLLEVDPYAALITGKHYLSLVRGRADEAYRAAEKAREEEARRRLPPLSEEDVEGALKHLRIFDDLSLFLCMTPPGVEEGTLPFWMKAENMESLPDGRQWGLSWWNEGELLMDPFPFEEPVELWIRVYEVERGPFASEEEAQKAWEARNIRHWRVVIRGSA